MTFPPKIGQFLLIVNRQMVWYDWAYRWYVNSGRDENQLGYWARRAQLRACDRIPISDTKKKNIEYTMLGVKMGRDEHGKYGEQYFRMTWPGRPKLVRL